MLNKLEENKGFEWDLNRKRLFIWLILSYLIFLKKLNLCKEFEYNLREDNIKKNL